jgi:Mg/Co/Ni transporter MgtE
MTEQLDPLLLKFASDRPDEMAALLVDGELPELAGILENLPVSSAARLAARLPSWQLTRLLAGLDPVLLAGILRAAKTDEAVALVSHLNESRYASVLDAVPATERRSLYELLEFPSYSVASLVTTDFIRVSENTSCGEFCEQLSASTDTSPRPVLVVDQQGRYRGIINLLAVYSRKNRSRQIGQIASYIEPLNGNMAARQAVTARQWTKYSQLPVVDSGQRILGVVNRASLERIAGDYAPLDFNFERVLSELATAYLSLCARVLESVFGRPK